MIVMCLHKRVSKFILKVIACVKSLYTHNYFQNEHKSRVELHYLFVTDIDQVIHSNIYIELRCIVYSHVPVC